MNSYYLSFLFILVFNFSNFSFGQDNLLTYDLKEGEAFDILLVTTKPNTKDTFKEYREKAFPVAVEMGYSFFPGFKITEVVQGKYEPKGLIFGKWKSMAMREKFLDDIEGRVPNFHDMRKEIWSLFSVTYYEVGEDYTFQLDTNKVIVATACWNKGNSDSNFESFIHTWKKALKETGGTIKLELVEGKSPLGYEYNPDYMVISQWDTPSDFEAFEKRNVLMSPDFLKHINQFVLEK